jgi:conjugal transfer pilus assembly protein TrbC
MVLISSPLPATPEDLVHQAMEAEQTQQNDASQFLKSLPVQQPGRDFEYLVQRSMETAKTSQDETQQAIAHSRDFAARFHSKAEEVVDHSKDIMQKESAKKPCRTCKGSVVSTLEKPQGEQLIVFVSFSMPDEALKYLYYHVAKEGGRLVIRGLLNDSFQQTKAKLEQLGIGIDIDPPLFEEFNVKRVPTFVFGNQKLLGNVSVKYALETMGVGHGS